jgi:hypothetical protein
MFARNVVRLAVRAAVAARLVGSFSRVLGMAA